MQFPWTRICVVRTLLVRKNGRSYLLQIGVPITQKTEKELKKHGIHRFNSR